jgi:hypothetical protein
MWGRLLAVKRCGKNTKATPSSNSGGQFGLAFLLHEVQDVAELHRPHADHDDAATLPGGAISPLTREALVSDPAVDLITSDGLTASVSDHGDALGDAELTIDVGRQDALVMQVERHGVITGWEPTLDWGLFVVLVDALLNYVATAVGAGSVVDQILGCVYDVVGSRGSGGDIAGELRQALLGQESGEKTRQGSGQERGITSVEPIQTPRMRCGSISVDGEAETVMRRNRWMPAGSRAFDRSPNDSVLNELRLPSDRYV